MEHKDKIAEIRKGRPADVDAIFAVYESAREYMRAEGNSTQWTGGYPSRELVENDIESGVCYVGTDSRGNVEAVFALIPGDDPTYAYIEDGEWIDSQPYATIHRIASSGRCSGVLNACVEFSAKLHGSLRIDTHACNKTMLEAVPRLGFVRCGIIYIADGTPRVAFQRVASVHRD